MQKIAAGPVTDDELKISKRGFIGPVPAHLLHQIPNRQHLRADEFTGRFARRPDYWKTYRSQMEAIGQDDVLRVAKKYLTPNKLVVLAVGQKTSSCSVTRITR